MKVYYIIDDDNRIFDEFDAEDDAQALGYFKQRLKEINNLREYLLVKKIHFGKQIVSAEVVLT